MRASRKAYGSNSFFQSYIKILYHQQDFCENLSSEALPGAREKGAKEMFGEERLQEEPGRRVGVS